MSNEYAFPRYRNCLYHEESGMTLRDYFAAKAMQGWATNPDSGCADKVAEWAYCMADAMLEARK